MHKFSGGGVTLECGGDSTATRRQSRCCIAQGEKTNQPQEASEGGFGSPSTMSHGYLELLRRADAFFDDVLQRDGSHLSCQAGCTACCHGLFEIGAADVSVIGQGLRALPPDERSDVVSRARAILEESSQPRLSDCDADEKERFFTATEDVPCPALSDEGRCRIYAHRPLVCRTFGLPVRDGENYLGQECELNFRDAIQSEKESAAWDLQWEDVLGSEDEYTIPEAIVISSLFRS